MAAATANTDMVLEGKEFKFFQDAIKQHAGISLSEAKRDLVQSRLRSRVLALGLKNYGEYKKHLEVLPPSHTEWQIFTNLLTTNKTDFFREPKHFDYLTSTYLKVRKSKEPLKIWSAACSTGEEPYTLAMVLARHMTAGQDFRILASDIDSAVLEKAAKGVFLASRIREQVPADYIPKTVDFGTGEISHWARIKPDLKSKISFKPHNLIENSYPGDEVFDLIFLRNVLIYFNPETIRFVVEKLYKSAKPGALLFIGHSESLSGIETSWKSVSPSVYKKGAE